MIMKIEVENAVEPTEAQVAAFLAASDDGPVHMVNLLKFKDKAEYPDGRESDLSGRDAYMLYGGPMAGLVMEAGGELKFSAAPDALLVGSASEEWDLVAIMTYPSAKVMVELTLSDAFKDISIHRKAGLAGQLLIPCFASKTVIG